MRTHQLDTVSSTHEPSLVYRGDGAHTCDGVIERQTDVPILLVVKLLSSHNELYLVLK